MSDTLDVITLQEAKTQIGGVSTVDDTLIAAYVTATSRTLDLLCGPIVYRTITSETIPVSWSSYAVNLRYQPVSSVTSVTHYDTAGNSTALTAETVSSKPASGYRLAAGKWNGQIERRSSGSPAAFAAGNVVVTYVPGRYATTATVDAKFKTAARMLFANVWRFEKGTGNQTFGDGGISLPGFLVPNAVMAMLADELLPPGIA